MSLINDALKQARKAPPRNTPASLSPLHPAAADDASLFPSWLLPVVVILLIVAAIFFIGWAVAHHSVRTIADAPESTAGPQAAAAISVPVVKPPPAEPSAPPINPPDGPKLQGIFYSPTAPSAIVDGKIIHPGDQFREFKVKAISKYTVTLVGPDKKEIRLGMDN
jgi:hypothetical protein